MLEAILITCLAAWLPTHFTIAAREVAELGLPASGDREGGELVLYRGTTGSGEWHIIMIHSGREKNKSTSRFILRPTS